MKVRDTTMRRALVTIVPDASMQAAAEIATVDQSPLACCGGLSHV